MLAIARYALKSPFHAATVAGILAVLSLFIPLVSILSGAIVGLVILTQGLVSGTRVILVSIVGITAVSYLITGSPLLGITIGLVQWLPMMVLAEILRRTASLSYTLLVGMGLALVAVAVQFLLWPDSKDLWLQFMLQLFEGTDQSGIDRQKLDQVLQNMVHWMTILLAAVMYSTFVATLFASRWFQARLADSDGYRNEFYSLKLGQTPAIGALVVLPAALMLQQDWLMAMLMVILSGFLYQGLAIAHVWSRQGRRTTWLFLLYAVMIVFPHAVAGTALLGVVDNWMNFRKNMTIHPRESD